VQGQILFISSLEDTVRDAEFVFEVVPEDLKIKQELFESMLPIISTSIFINIASVSAHGIELSSIPSIGLCVGLSVSLSRKCTVAKRLIGSGWRLGW